MAKHDGSHKVKPGFERIKGLSPATSAAVQARRARKKKESKAKDPATNGK